MPVTRSLIVPVYRNAESVPRLLDALRALAQRVEALELVFVVDGSPDRSYELLQAGCPTLGAPATVVRLSRNFGAFAAVKKGLAVARGERCAVIAADLQEPPELVEQMFAALDGANADLAVGVRESRADPWSSRLGAALFWGLYRRLVQPSMPAGGIDVFACTRAVRDVVVQLEEANSSLVGQLCWIGFRRVEVPYQRQARAEGRSAWTLRKKLRYMLDSAFAFSDLPINLLLTGGALGLLGSIALALAVFVAWWRGSIPVLGYTPVMLSLLASTSLNVFCMGVIGSYLWRTFENTKRRPQHLELSRESWGYDEPAEGDDEPAEA